MTYREVGVETARKTLGELATDAAVSRQITVLTSHRRPVAAIVPLDLLPADSEPDSTQGGSDV